MQSVKFSIDLENKTFTQSQFDETSYLKDDRIYSRKDTLIIYYEKTFKLPEKSFNEFLHTINTNPFDSTTIFYKVILDGISYRIHSIDSNQDTLTLASNYSGREDKTILAYTYFDALFELIQSIDNDYQGDYMIEGIKEYFDYEKSIKPFERSIEKIADHPLEYRLWSQSNVCDSTAILSFLEELPADIPILFDLGKEKFPFCFEILISERNDKKELYYYGSKRIRQLEEDIDWMKEAIENPKDALPENLTLLKAKELLNDDIKIKKRLNRMHIFVDRSEVIEAIEN